jgi:hypothetical protein
LVITILLLLSHGLKENMSVSSLRSKDFTIVFKMFLLIGKIQHWPVKYFLFREYSNLNIRAVKSIILLVGQAGHLASQLKS